MDSGRVEIAKSIVLFCVCVVIAVLASTTHGDECPSQNCGANATIEIQNAVPQVHWVENPASITFSGFQNTTVFVAFNVTDDNGAADLNDSTAQVCFIKAGETTRCGAGENCTGTDSGNHVFYNCSVRLWFYDGSGSWDVNASIFDNNDDYASNKTQTVTVNSLDYVDSNTTSLSWTSIAPGTDDAVADTTQLYINGGNQDYSSMTVTGYNATSGSNIIYAENFSYDDASDGLSEIQLDDDVAVDVSGIFTLTACTSPCATNSTEEGFFFVDIPAGQTAATYYSNQSWSFSIST
jgi:hypothetical protein